MKRANSLSALSSRPIESNWLLSFGDLLTLLLAFFISVFSLSPLNPAVRSAKNSERHEQLSTDSRSDKPGFIPRAIPGTALADIGSGARSPTQDVRASKAEHLDIWLSAADFEEGTDELGIRAQARIRTQVIGNSYRVLGIKIQSCSELPPELEDIGWMASSRRILALRRQFLDAGVGAEQLRYRVLGSDCTGLREGAQAGDEGATVRITIERDMSNG